MSPALPREERDAIRARAEAAPDGFWYVDVHGGVWVDHSDGGGDSASGLTGPLPIWAGGAAEFIAHARTDVPALLAALDAAEAENGRLTLAEQGYHWQVVETERVADALDAARAEVAALRGRVVRMADSLDRLAANAPSTYAGIRHTIAGELRALAADEGEEKIANLVDRWMGRDDR